MKNRVFFEPPSRLQVLDKLKHMVRFSDFLLLVSGERGAGKSTLVKNLKPDLNDTTLFCCVVRSDTGLEQEQVLDLLLSQLPLHEDVESDFSGRLKAFYLQLKAMRDAGQKCLIIVDDAENLSGAALELLLNLHQADNSSGCAQLLLLMNNNFSDKLLNSKPVKLLEGRVHQLRLDKMTDEETKEYIAVCHPAAASLPDKKLAQLLQLAEGLPGRVDRLISGEKVSSHSSQSSAKSFPLPAAHMGGIGMILIGIFAISLWQFFPESEESTEKSVGETISLPLDVPVVKSEDGAVSEILVSETPTADKAESEPPSKTLIDVKQELENKLALQEKKMEEKNSSPELLQKKTDEAPSIAEELKEIVTTNVPLKTLSKSEPVSEAPPSVEVTKVEAVAEQRPVAKVIKPVEAKTKPTNVKASAYTASENQILSWAASGYTLQMLGARSKDSALAFIKDQKKSENFYYFSTIYKGAPWYVVVHGEYANRDIANAAIKKLPAELRKMRPWARSVRGVQIDIKKK